jgi:alpha-amylase
VYYGEELGMPNGPGDDDRQKRTPMRWTATEGGGFSSGQPWFPPSTTDPAVSVEAQAGDPASVLEAYRSAIALRAAHPALASGGAIVLRGLPSAVLAVWRTLEGEAPVLVLANLSNRELEVDAAQLAAPGVDAGGLVPIDGAGLDGDAPGVWSLPANTLRLLGPAR